MLIFQVDSAFIFGVTTQHSLSSNTFSSTVLFYEVTKLGKVKMAADSSPFYKKIGEN